MISSFNLHIFIYGIQYTTFITISYFLNFKLIFELFVIYLLKTLLNIIKKSFILDNK
jgi:hypothetical protein